MSRAKIIVLCVLAAMTYGVIHDEVTARVCLEYFTVAHPPLFPVTSPTLLALCWGSAATVGIGLVCGVLLALVADRGREPPWPVSRLVAPIVRLLVAMAVAALVAGLCGFYLAERSVISLPAGFAEVIPLSRRDQFMAVWFAHGASYLVGLTGGGWLVYRVWRARGRPHVVSVVPRSLGGVIRAAVIAAVGAYLLWLRFGAR